MFLIVALSDLDINMCDIGNYYLNVETRERLWFTAGDEWGNRKGYQVIIIRELYVLKSSGSKWKRRLRIISVTPLDLNLVLEPTVSVSEKYFKVSSVCWGDAVDIFILKTGLS